MERFREDKRNNLREFALAAHAIADFYAHSSYAHFADNDSFNNKPCVVPYDITLPLGGLDKEKLIYDSGTFDLTNNKFSFNPYYWKKTKAEAAKEWNGEIISGRYAQEDDTRDGLLSQITEGLTWIQKEFRDKKDFPRRGALPHHNEIAVDEDKLDPKIHKLYTKPGEYKEQFDLRKTTAIRHIQEAFLGTLPGDKKRS